MRRRALLLAAACAPWAAARAQSGFDHAHAAWTALLARHVKPNAAGNASRVDYKGFAAERRQGVIAWGADQRIRGFRGHIGPVGGDPGLERCRVPHGPVRKVDLFDAVIGRQEIILHGNLVADIREAQDEVVLALGHEQLLGEDLDARADQFPFGVIAYELLTGKLPFRTDGGGLGLVTSILNDEPRPLEGVSPELESIVMRCLAKPRDQRHAAMEDIAEALAPLLAVELPPPELRGR